MRLCYEHPMDPFSLGACGGLELGILRGSPFGITLPQRQTRPWAGATAGLVPAFHLNERFAIILKIQTIFLATRPIFTVGNLGEIHRLPLLAGRAALAGEVRFP